MSKNIQELEEDFVGIGSEVRGFQFKQLKKKDSIYLYKVSSPESPSHYEVFEAKNSPICLDFATRSYSDTEFREHYPKGKDFGRSAWNYYDEKLAEEKFNELLK